MGNKNTYYNLTTPQKSILYTEQYYKTANVNSVIGKIHFNNKLNINLLSKTIKLLYIQNDALRTRIEKVDNDYVQSFPIDIKPIIDIINLFNDDDEDKIIKSIAKKHIPILNNLLVKFVIIKHSDDSVDVVSFSHHIVADAWTVSLYATEIIRIYTNLKNKEIPSNINNSYIEYINEEANYMANDKIKKDMEFWNNKYLVEPNISFFPVNNTIKGKRTSFVIDTIFFNKIHNFCKLNKISEQCLFMSAFAIYLSKISSSENISIGMPILNRNNAASKKIMGMFIETLPFLVNINRKISCIDFLKYIASEQFSLLKHHQYPYEQLQKDVKSKFSTNQKLYTVAFSFQNAKIETIDSIDFSTSWEFNGYCPDDLQIHISNMEDLNIFNIYYDYKVNTFDKNDIEDLHNRLLFIIDQIVNFPNLTISDIELLANKEKEKVLSYSNGNLLSYDDTLSISEIISKTCLKYPNKIAVNDYYGNSITYSELDQKANDLANTLLTNKIKANDVVCIFLNDKSVYTIISILAVLKVGASFILLYPGLPDERIKYIIDNSDAKFIIADKEHLNKYQNLINININNILKFSGLNITTNTSNNIAYLIYTSGTTGKPKGIEIKNNNLVNFVYSFNNHFSNNFSAKDNFLSLTNVSFDVSMSEMFTPLFFGATLTLYKDIAHSSIEELCKFIYENKITFSYFPPSMLNEVADELLKYKDKLSLSKMLVGVEPISTSTLQKFIDIIPNIEIINGYGPSETTICSTMYKFDSNCDDYEIVPIGSPLDNTQVYILNSDKNLLPVNTVGELYISGNGVGNGYKNNSELTKEKYIDYIGHRTFKTGDLGKWDKNGNIVFVGRNDNQIKFRGYRIDLGEIENSLKSCNDVQNAFILLDKNNFKEEKLIAFVILKDKSILEESLRDFLSKTLPYYMLPSKFVKLNNFPLTANGKIDKTALLEISNHISKKEIFVSPQNETEQIILNIIQSKLQIEHISTTDNFFDIGIDSLEAISLIVDFEKNGLSFSLQDFYNYPSIRLLANKLDNDKKGLTSIDPSSYQKNVILNKNHTCTIDGNVLLFGSTGFLGCHILKNLIEQTNVKIYCLVRAISNKKASERLEEKLSFYFDDSFYQQNIDRIIAIKGDFTDTNFGMNSKDFKLVTSDCSILINSAACVKHFGNEEYFYNVNYLSVKRAANYCLENNKQFIQISTMSVLYECDTNNILNESTLYDNQNLDNVYVKTKFDAEQFISTLINKGLNATIFRLGNIMWRHDGKFQENENENSFILKLKTILKYKLVPKSILNTTVDLSPVDLCAKAIVKLLLHNNLNVYHIENNNILTIKQLLKLLKCLNINIKVIDDDYYKENLLNFSNDNTELFSLIENVKKMPKVNSFNSIASLKKVNFTWNKVTATYLKNYLLH